jgi:hypothetical protein
MAATEADEDAARVHENTTATKKHGKNTELLPMAKQTMVRRTSMMTTWL